ncbi:uncharacterized protein CLUP02_17263 [Colletotrichum lupini]|uniref:Uncharacterized protein n=1 Tax=Colletotrichum lupini TaxID=145971 RepID=A0A9Q8WAS9_9PEZI|nr:uncharacterized protein CLUP02_17263 [Colletotrichum lupini]UQC75755.1 hypothetical protein CLUP02_17263 [Colletotrichum lupini]
MDVDCLYFFLLLLLLPVGQSRWTACVKLCGPSTGATSVQQASLFLLISQSATPETPKAKVKDLTNL